ncbi:substrate-binding domain-containing protein [Vagococcus elongatus]|uniref:GntR family transcriptional regulator n=1 Tax=Vagococcus elongatus TaxID=180344 RepID=A0A430APE6_9ENTE|nr:GntR family transcriptional regulator [Vagococcus elongatus]RSU09991.1 GntR family transcriptional regulator [Vagococcus elongatus]
MSKAKYQLIADEIRSKILAKEYHVGDVIPPETQLQKDFNVSRHTVRQAIALLVNEGHLKAEKGSGTYVQMPAPQTFNGAKKKIGVITTYLSDYIFPSIIRGIEQELRENNYGLLLASTNNDLSTERRCLEMMLHQGVSGLIVEPTKSNEYNPNLSYYVSLKERDIPVLMINAHYEELDFPFIVVDDVASGYLATKHLIDQGHKNLAMVTKIDDLQGKLRMKGFINAHTEANQLFESNCIYTYTTETKQQVIETILADLNQQLISVTGIVCYNDEIANQLAQQLIRRGFSIPNDFSITGNDDSYLSTAGEIALTTVSHPKEQLGAEAVQSMIKKIEQQKPLENKIYTPKLIVRDSTRKLV